MKPVDDVFQRLLFLEYKALFLLLYVVAFLAIVGLVLLCIKFRHRSFVKSVQVEKYLRLTPSGENDFLIKHVNNCVKRSTVQFKDEKRFVAIHIPTKRLTELSSSMEVKSKIKDLISSDDFREVLADMFGDYRFESKPRFRNNEYVIRGTRL